MSTSRTILHERARTQFTKLLASLKESGADVSPDATEVLWQFFLHGAEWGLAQPPNYKH